MRPTLVILLLSAAAAAPSFDEFLAAHPEKQYSGPELDFRRGLFLQSVERVERVAADPSLTFELEINRFSDMTAEEIRAFKGYSGNALGAAGLVAMDPPAGFLNDLLPMDQLPSSVDWRTKKVVTPTKNQGGCGSCWAFSATEVMESHVAIATGKLLVLSPQQLVSCAPDPDDCGGSGGCGGSTQWLGFNYTVSAGGLSLDKTYPYTADTGTCQAQKVKPAAGIKGYVRLPPNNYQALMNAVARLGPVAISVDASWGGYSKGVYNGACGTTIDHAVVLVGYGTDDIGGPYYLVRNSWGSEWGEKGYIRIARNDTDSTNCGINKDPSSGTECKPYPKTQKVCGLCGILSDSSYPTGGFLV